MDFIDSSTSEQMNRYYNVLPRVGECSEGLGTNVDSQDPEMVC